MKCSIWATIPWLKHPTKYLDEQMWLSDKFDWKQATAAGCAESKVEPLKITTHKTANYCNYHHLLLFTQTNVWWRRTRARTNNDENVVHFTRALHLINIKHSLNWNKKNKKHLHFFLCFCLEFGFRMNSFEVRTFRVHSKSKISW